MTTTITVSSTFAADSVTVIINGQKQYVALSDAGPVALRDLLNAVFAKADLPLIPESGSMERGTVTVVQRDEAGGVRTTQPTRNVDSNIGPGAQVVVGKDFHMGGITVSEARVASSITVIINGQQKHIALSEDGEAVPVRDLLNAIYGEVGIDLIPDGEDMPVGTVTVVQRDEAGGVQTTQPSRNVDTPVSAGAQVVVGKDFHMGG